MTIGYFMLREQEAQENARLISERDALVRDYEEKLTKQGAELKTEIDILRQQTEAIRAQYEDTKNLYTEKCVDMDRIVSEHKRFKAECHMELGAFLKSRFV